MRTFNNVDTLANLQCCSQVCDRVLNSASGQIQVYYQINNQIWVHVGSVFVQILDQTDNQVLDQVKEMINEII